MTSDFNNVKILKRSGFQVKGVLRKSSMCKVSLPLKVLKTFRIPKNIGSIAFLSHPDHHFSNIFTYMLFYERKNLGSIVSDIFDLI